MGVAELDLRSVAGGSILLVRVTPRARRDAIEGEREGALRVRLRAVPAEGAANKALVQVLARVLAVAPTRLSVSSGTSSRSKRVMIAGLTVDGVRERLAGVLAAAGEGTCERSA